MASKTQSLPFVMMQILMNILSLPVASQSCRWMCFTYLFIKSEQLSKVETSVLFWTKRFLHTRACQLQLSLFKGLTTSIFSPCRIYLPFLGLFFQDCHVFCRSGWAPAISALVDSTNGIFCNLSTIWHQAVMFWTWCSKALQQHCKAHLAGRVTRYNHESSSTRCTREQGHIWLFCHMPCFPLKSSMSMSLWTAECN